MSEHIIAKESKIHILVNNSGATWGAPWADFPEKEGWDRVLALNVKAIWYLTAALTPLLVKNSDALHPGRVINISSVAGLDPKTENGTLSDAGTGVYSYSVSKAAVNHLTSIQAVSLATKFVTVNAILPGVFPSKMTAFGLAKQSDKIIEQQPTGMSCSTNLRSLELALTHTLS